MNTVQLIIFFNDKSIIIATFFYTVAMSVENPCSGVFSDLQLTQVFLILLFVFHCQDFNATLGEL